MPRELIQRRQSPTRHSKGVRRRDQHQQPGRFWMDHPGNQIRCFYRTGGPGMRLSVVALVVSICCVHWNVCTCLGAENPTARSFSVKAKNFHRWSREYCFLGIFRWSVKRLRRRAREWWRGRWWENNKHEVILVVLVLIPDCNPCIPAVALRGR
jgi:hypothetical protein